MHSPLWYKSSGRRTQIGCRSRDRQNREIVAVLGLSVVILAIFSPSLFSEFIRDDRWQIVKNPQIQSWGYLPQLFSTHLWSQLGTDRSVHFYRPLFSVWMLTVATMGGLSSVWWHFASILL